MRSQVVVRHTAKIQKANSCFLISSFPDTILSPIIKSISAFLPPQGLDFPSGGKTPVLISQPWDVKLNQWNEMHVAIDPVRTNMIIAEFSLLLVGCIVEFHIEVETGAIHLDIARGLLHEKLNYNS